MAWAPENSNVPPTQNVSNEGDTFCTVAAATTRLENREMLKADDLTIMIPYGSDSETRVNNFAKCLTNLIWNTNANISIYWSETKEGISRFVGNHPHATEALTKFFSKNSSTGFLRDVSKEMIEVQLLSDPGKTITKTAFEVMADVAVYKPLDNFKLPNSVTYGDLLAKANGRVNSSTSPVRLTALCDAVEKQLSERLTLYVELREEGQPFHRMKYLNKMLSAAKTEFVCNHDADVMIPPSGFSDSISRLRNYPAIDVVYPYSATANAQVKFFHGAGTDARAIKSALTGDFTPIVCGGNQYLADSMYGLAFFARTSSYKRAFGENEDFVSWGPEDVERYYRFCKMGLRVSRIVDGYVVHLEHERGVDSGKPNPHLNNNNLLWKELQSLDPTQLVTYYRDLEYPSLYGFGG